MHARHLCRGAASPTRSSWSSCPDGDRLRYRGGDDAEGHDGAIPPAPDLRGEARRHDPVPRRRRRRRAHRVPMGEAPRRDRDRHRRLARTRPSSPRQNGCDHVILYREEDFATRVKEITGGEGVPVVYDGVGKATFPGSLDCLKPLGMFVSFGSASGPIEAFNIGILAQKGSLFVTRPTLVHPHGEARDPRRDRQGPLRRRRAAARSRSRSTPAASSARPRPSTGRSKAARPPAPPSCTPKSVGP